MTLASLQDQTRHVIVLRRIAHKHIQIHQQATQHLRRGRSRFAIDRPHRPRLVKFLSTVIDGLDHAIGEDDQPIATFESRLAGLISGLGKRAKIDSLTITWPSGQVDKLTSVPVDKIIAVKEGVGIVARPFPKVSSK